MALTLPVDNLLVHSNYNTSQVLSLHGNRSVLISRQESHLKIYD